MMSIYIHISGLIGPTENHRGIPTWIQFAELVEPHVRLITVHKSVCLLFSMVSSCPTSRLAGSPFDQHVGGIQTIMTVFVVMLVK